MQKTGTASIGERAAQNGPQAILNCKNKNMFR
jgi:hypothetical protein